MTDGKHNPNQPEDCRAWSTVEFTQPEAFWDELKRRAENGEAFVANPDSGEVSGAK